MMPEFEVGESIVLLIMACGYVPVVWTYWESRSTKWFFWGYTALLIGLISTNVEAFAFPVELQWIEHIVGVMLAGAFFFIWARKNYQEQFFLHQKLEAFSKSGGKK